MKMVLCDETVSSVLFFVLMCFGFQEMAARTTISGNSEVIGWGEDNGLDIVGHWSVPFQLKGCAKLLIGLWGPNKSLTSGYYIDINVKAGGNYYTAIRKICPVCPQTPKAESNQGEAYACGSYVDVWVSWDGCTIRMGKGTVVKNEEVVSWMDMEITEIKYITFGVANSAWADYSFNSMTANNDVNTEQNCDNVPCTAQSRPAFTNSGPLFVFHHSGIGKTFSNPAHVIFNGTGLTLKQCSFKCLCDARCIQFSSSTTGTCMLSNKCYPTLASDPTSTVQTLTTWG